MRFQETWAFWTELNSFAALEVLTDSLVKQVRNAVNAAMSQLAQPVPATFLPPSHKMSTAPSMDTTWYSGGRVFSQRLAAAAFRS